MEDLKKLLDDTKKFRNKLVSRMQELDSKKINCMNCSGVCCTKARNSMMVTPVEAFDLYFFLEENIKDKETLWKNIEQSIVDFGLDREIYVKNKLMRKNYTCPLFKFESFGCPIDPHLKPFGCLGYNAFKEGVKEGENCSSETELLEVVDLEISQELSELNQKLKGHLKLDFDKLPIPKALILCKKIVQGP
jgi:hypothetical protein